MEQTKIITGIRDLDNKLLGGIGVGELGVVIGTAKSGRTKLLVRLGAEAVKAGFRVAHIAGEDKNYVVSKYKDHNLGALEEGRLMLYPAWESVTVHDITRKVLEKLIKSDKKPDVLIIDGIESISIADTLNRSVVLRLLKQVAKDLGVAIWVSAQIGQQGPQAYLFICTDYTIKVCSPYDEHQKSILWKGPLIEGTVDLS